MIRTLIVDDEHLVRKGLIHSFPWDQFGMQVVGEADNGETALEMLHKQPVDLLMTDLTMPVMSGFELMQQVRLSFPEMFIVVLTCHSDFDYIQETLRLGAIDYVVKTQLEKESMEAVLARISKRIKHDDEFRYGKMRTATGAISVKPISWGVLLIKADKQVAQVEDVSWAHPAQTTQISEDKWFIYFSDGQIDADIRTLLRQLPSGHWMSLIITDIAAGQAPSFSKNMLNAAQSRLFYDWRPEQLYVKVSVRELMKPVYATNTDRGISVNWSRSWNRLGWLIDDEEWEKMKLNTLEERLAPEKLVSFIVHSLEGWRYVEAYPQLNTMFSADYSFVTWYRLMQWVENIRDIWKGIFKKSGCSREVFTSVLRSVLLLQKELSDGANQSDIASRVNISRGYFSGVFKDIIGKVFNEFVRDMRISTAKKLLHDYPEKPIYWIAEQTGFQDESYFSRVFKENTGRLPSDYR